MPFVPVENTVQVELRYIWQGQQVENTLYFSKTVAWTVPNMQTLGNNLVDWWDNYYRAHVVASCSLREILIRDLTTVASPAVSWTDGLPLDGLSGDEGIPNNVAPVISFRTAFSGRSFRGRNYLVGMPDGDVAGNVIVPDYITDMTAAYMQLLNVADSNSADWVVVSRFSGVDPVTGEPIPRTAGVPTPITNALFTDNIVDSQRRRLPGRGR